MLATLMKALREERAAFFYEKWNFIEMLISNRYDLVLSRRKANFPIIFQIYLWSDSFTNLLLWGCSSFDFIQATIHWENNAIEPIAFLSKGMYITNSNRYAIELVTYLLVLVVYFYESIVYILLEINVFDSIAFFLSVYRN